MERIRVTDDIRIDVDNGRIRLCTDDGYSRSSVDVDQDVIDVLKRKLDLAGLIAVEQQEMDPCPFTHSHTRNWCGHAGCRKS